MITHYPDTRRFLSLAFNLPASAPVVDCYGLLYDEETWDRLVSGTSSNFPYDIHSSCHYGHVFNIVSLTSAPSLLVPWRSDTLCKDISLPWIINDVVFTASFPFSMFSVSITEMNRYVAQHWCAKPPPGGTLKWTDVSIPEMSTHWHLFCNGYSPPSIPPWLPEKAKVTSLHELQWGHAEGLVQPYMEVPPSSRQWGTSHQCENSGAAFTMHANGWVASTVPMLRFQ